MSRSFVVAAVVLASLVTSSTPAQARRAPHITDPAGDVLGYVCPVPGVFFACLAAAKPYAQPAVDLVSVDFNSPGAALVAEVGVLDLDAPVVGQGTEGYDGTRYFVAFSPDPSRSLWVNFVAEYDRAAVSTRAELIVSTNSFGGNPSSARPIEVMADIGRNRVRFDTPLAALNEAIALVCPDCSPVVRGSVLQFPAGHASVFDDGTLGRSAIAIDATPNSTPPYVVGT